MPRLGILGGTFDPPHLGHLALAKNAFEKLSLDKLLFVPARVPPHKSDISVTPEVIRFEMLNIMISGIPDYEITDIEFQRTGKSYTYDTLLELKQAYPDYLLYFIIGADNIQEMESWHKPEELVRMANFAAANRPGFEPTGKFSQYVTMFEMNPVDISSTEIRKLIRSGDDVRGFLHPDVNMYIKENGIYTENE